jgi:hypothetical protein
MENHIINTWQQAGYFYFSGALSGDDLADFLLGRASSFNQGGGEYKLMHGTRVGIYAQDNWRVSRKLTLNLGLRWDPYLPYVEELQRGACFVPGKQSLRYPNAPLGMLFVGGQDQSLGCPKNHSWPSLSNYAPRAGFAYRLTQDGKTSLRGGSGIYYLPPPTGQFNADADIAPFAPAFTLTDVSFDDPWGSAGIPNPFPAQFGPTIPGSTAPFTLPITLRYYYKPDYHIDTVYSWNLTLERELARDWVLKAAYVGNKGTYLGDEYKTVENINPAIYIPGQSTEANTQQRRRYTDFSTIGIYAGNNNSHYNSLQLGVEKRFSHGLTTLANYTWEKSMDDYGWSDPFYRDFMYGKSDENIPQNFTWSNTWQIPTPHMTGAQAKILGGWQTNSILSWHAGFPFSILSGVDNSFSGVGADRADFTGTNIHQAVLGSRSHGQEVAKWFNTSLFVPNAIGTFGDSGRNILQGPKYFDMDLGLFKTTHVTERVSIQFRAEFFNIFNDVNFQNPGNTLGSGFGQITSALDPRILQFALKVLY